MKNKHKAFFLFVFLTAFFALPTLALAQQGHATPWQLGMPEAASPVKHMIHDFHNLMLAVIGGVTLLVMVLLLVVIIRFRAKVNPVPSKTTHNTLLEVVWTAVPVLLLIVIIIPSMRLLYFADRAADAEMTLKVTGYQWYWGYQYPDHGDIEFASYMVKDEDLKPGDLRLLTTDTAVVIPVDTTVRLLATAADVLHSWAVPALGVKIDTVPGRLNETWFKIEKEGFYYGQCSELCGDGHGFMPIMIKAVSKQDFESWVIENGGAMPQIEQAAQAGE